MPNCKECGRPTKGSQSGFCGDCGASERYHDARSGPGLWEAYRHHLEACRRRPITIYRYRQVLYGFWVFTGHLEDPRNVTKKDLQNYLYRISDSPRSRGQRISARTACQDGQILQRAYRWFADEALLGRNRNPLGNFIPPRVEQGPPRALSMADVQRLLRKAEADNPRMATMLHLAYWGGMRVGEIAHLTIEDITPGYGPQPTTLLVNGKGGKQRRIPAHPELVAWLERYLADRPDTGPVVESARFPGQPITPHLVSRAVGDYMKRNGVRESAHSLRHSRATHMLMQSPNGDLRPLQRFLGHSTSRTTERYTDAWDGELNRLAVM
jgi:integrase/recombinase XerC